MPTTTQRSLVADLGLLVRVLRDDTTDLASRLDEDPTALGAAVALGASQGLSVPLHRVLASSPLRERVPAEALAALGQRHDEQVERARALVAELPALADRFAAAGQPFLLLKGPYLAELLYGDYLAREYADLDVLVPRADRRRVAALLRAAGYSRRSRVIGGEQATAFFVHAFDYRNGATTVDLHWCLSRQPTFRVSEAAIWSGKRPCAIAGRTYDVLSAEHEVLFGVLSILRDIERGRPKLKAIVELVLLIERIEADVDWDAFLCARRGDGTYGPSVNVLALCLEATGGHAWVPRVGDALVRHAARLVPIASPAVLLQPSSLGLASKRWCIGIYDGTPAEWLAWWVTSLPFRTVVHRRPVREWLRKRTRRVWRPVRREGRRYWRLVKKRVRSRLG